MNFWDAHTPYRTPEEFGNPFENDPMPDWLTEEVLSRHLEGFGPECAREPVEFQAVCRQVEPHPWARFPRQFLTMDSMADVRRMFDGYDTGIRYADEHAGMLLDALADQGVLDETAIVVSSDHGESLGELNIYSCHMTADDPTVHVPLIMRIPGVTDSQQGRADSALHYHVDWAAALVELAGGSVPESWDGVGFADALRAGQESGRPYLVCSHMAGTCQRAVRFDDYLLLRSYHDGYHGFPDVMLFDLVEDPHEQNDLAPQRPDVVNRGLAMLDDWLGQQMRTATHAQDPMWTVMQAGGPEHTRGFLPLYIERLRETGRDQWADMLAAKHPREL